MESDLVDEKGNWRAMKKAVKMVEIEAVLRGGKMVEPSGLLKAAH